MDDLDIIIESLGDQNEEIDEDDLSDIEEEIDSIDEEEYPEPALFEGPIALVDEEKIRLCIVGDEDIHQAVAIEVRNRNAHALAQRLADSAGLRHVFKAAVAQVAIEPRRHARVDGGAAILLALGVHPALLVGLRSPHRVVGHKQVEQSVVVVVEPGRAYAKHVLRLVLQSRAGRHIGKSPVAVVVIQRIGARVADEQIIAAVIVVVAHGHAKAEAKTSAAQPGLGRYIFEGAVSLVAQHAVVEVRSGLYQFRKLGAIGKEKIHAPVVVVIDHAHAAAHGLGKIFSSREVVMGPIREHGAAGHIGKPKLLLLPMRLGTCMRGGRRR